jgi:predicted DNA-binding transcriptional regulator YafY
MNSPTKLQRWLDLIAYLVGRRLPVSADELMRGVPAYSSKWESGSDTDRDSARRMFERDKDELRAFGIPIRTIRYSMGALEQVDGYQIDRRDFYLPYLKLVNELSGGGSHYSERAAVAGVEIAEDDAALALNALRRAARVPGFPLAREARSAFRKLAFDLDPGAFEGGAPVLFVDKPGAAELSNRLHALTEALLARKRMTFRYHGIYRDEATDRSVDAYGLLFQHGHWYLVGHDHTRGARRVFRVGRMDDIVVNRARAKQADYEIPDDFRLDELAGRQAWDLGAGEEQPLVARVLFRFPLSLWAERNGYGERVEQRAGGDVVREFRVHQLNPFLRWVLSLETEVELLEPDTLRDELRTMAREIAAAHASPGDDA